jgi:hypothetical protein
MCRNIRTLFNFDPPVSEDELRDAALQYVRKISGMRAPSQANAEAFDRAVEDVAAASRRLMGGLATKAPPRNRDEERAKARARWEQRAQRMTGS